MRGLVKIDSSLSERTKRTSSSSSSSGSTKGSCDRLENLVPIGAFEQQEVTISKQSASQQQTSIVCESNQLVLVAFLSVMVTLSIVRLLLCNIKGVECTTTTTNTTTTAAATTTTSVTNGQGRHNHRARNGGGINVNSRQAGQSHQDATATNHIKSLGSGINGKANEIDASTSTSWLLNDDRDDRDDDDDDQLDSGLDLTLSDATINEIQFDDQEDNANKRDAHGVIYDEPNEANPNSPPHRDHNDQEEDEDEDEVDELAESEEDPEEFYQANPVDQRPEKAFLPVESDPEMRQLNGLRFKDFDREASGSELELNFYGNQRPLGKSKPKLRPTHRPNDRGSYRRGPGKKSSRQRRPTGNRHARIDDIASSFYKPHKNSVRWQNHSMARPRVRYSSLPRRKPQSKYRQRPRANRYLASASSLDDVNLRASGSQLGANCALVLQRGVCISYDDVEEAAQDARDRLRFRLTSAQLQSPEPSEATIHAVGSLNELTTRILARRFRLNWAEVASELEHIDIRRTTLWRDCPIIFRVSPLCSTLNRYRTHTGLCNNPLLTHLGSTNMPFLRMLPGDYGDGVGTPRRASLSRNPLPPARLVALTLHPNIENPSIEHSAMFMSWGQLINHDVAMASGAREGTGHGDPCCPDTSYRDVCMPIELARSDPLYGPLGLRCHEFKRSIAGLRPGCSLGPRTQTNTITSFVDASFVYGSSKSMTRSLRRSERGLLEMWDLFESEGLKEMLPAQRDNPDQECVGRAPRAGRPFCFRSGDVRTNQHVQLVSLHTIHARQHNRIATALRQMNPHWTSNRIYHEARHIHIAMVQHILLSEYLPALLGPKLCKKYNLTESPLGTYWDHYDASLNPGVSQAFAAAAFRQGHTRVPSLVYRVNAMHGPVRVYQLRELFRQPWPLFEPGALDQFVLGMLDTPAASYDPFMSLELSGHLLQMPDERVGLDLASMNIQRGRDQALPGYNAFRDWCGLGRAKSHEELLKVMNSQSVSGMASLYESIDDIDLFTGGVSEYPVEGAQVGPTFACIIGRQFETLRAADRFWFESSLGPNAFTLAQLDSIKQVSLARLLCVNSDGVISLQQHALLQPHPVLNPRAPCASLPDLDISLWFEPPGGPIINPASGRRR